VIFIWISNCEIRKKCCT